MTAASPGAARGARGARRARVRARRQVERRGRRVVARRARVGGARLASRGVSHHPFPSPSGLVCPSDLHFPPTAMCGRATGSFSTASTSSDASGAVPRAREPWRSGAVIVAGLSSSLTVDDATENERANGARNSTPPPSGDGVVGRPPPGPDGKKGKKDPSSHLAATEARPTHDCHGGRCELWAPGGDVPFGYEMEDADLCRSVRRGAVPARPSACPDDVRPRRRRPRPPSR